MDGVHGGLKTHSREDKHGVLMGSGSTHFQYGYYVVSSTTYEDTVGLGKVRETFRGPSLDRDKIGEIGYRGIGYEMLKHLIRLFNGKYSAWEQKGGGLYSH